MSWRATIAGLCATLVGIGLARFAYTPLIPALIAADWLTPSEAAYLGAANLAGYLAGALLGRPLAARTSAVASLRGLMVLATVAFFACAMPVSVAWFFAWRLAAGIAGGGLMVLAAPTVLPMLPPERRGLAGGIIFTGVGLGIATSGTLVPWLLRRGLVDTWCGLGVLALVLTLVAWPRWPPAARPRSTPARRAGVPSSRPALRMIYVEYGLNAAGLVPHMVFLVDFIARGLGEGLEVGARYWVLVGLGATFGPVLAGRIADGVGFGATLRGALVLQAVSVGVLAAAPTTMALVGSSLVIGACIPGVVPVVLGRIHELLGEADASPAWSVATTSFALLQAVGAWSMSFVYARTSSHALLFALGAGMLVLALVIDIVAPRGVPTG